MVKIQVAEIIRTRLFTAKNCVEATSSADLVAACYMEWRKSHGDDGGVTISSPVTAKHLKAQKTDAHGPLTEGLKKKWVGCEFP